MNKKTMGMTSLGIVGTMALVTMMKCKKKKRNKSNHPLSFNLFEKYVYKESNPSKQIEYSVVKNQDRYYLVYSEAKDESFVDYTYLLSKAEIEEFRTIVNKAFMKERKYVSDPEKALQQKEGILSCLIMDGKVYFFKKNLLESFATRYFQLK